MSRQRRVPPFAAVAAAAVVAALAWPAPHAARPLYVVTTTDGVTTVTTSYARFVDSLDAIRRATLNAQFRPGNPAFDPDASALSVTLQARGLVFDFQTPQGSPALTLSIPAVRYTGTFTGRTRDESLEQIEEWFKKNGGEILSRLAKKNAEQSPVDPLAGNPGSAQARTVDTGFDRGFFRLTPLFGAAGVGAARSDGEEEVAGGSPQVVANTVSVGAQWRGTVGPYGSGSYTLPIGYGWRFDDDARHQLSFDVPITYQSVEGGHVYSLGLGVGYSHPLNDHWVLTAGVDYGLAASVDLGANGHMLTPTLTSLVTVPVARWLLLHVGNLAGYSTSLPWSIGDYASDPGISNWVVKNGLMLFFPTPGLWRSSGFELFAADTRFFGTDLYASGYTEIGVSFGLSDVKLHGGKRYDSVLRVGATVLLARDNDGIIVNTGYQF